MMMNQPRIIACILAIACGLLGGCVSPVLDQQYGNFGGFTAEYELVIANESADRIAAVFPPSQTRLNLRQPTPDAFGVALVANLRAKGYAISEYAAGVAPLGTENPSQMNRDQRADAGIDMNYILDHPDPDLLRVTVFVAQRSLSRAYTTTRGRLIPFGAWVVKE